MNKNKISNVMVAFIKLSGRLMGQFHMMKLDATPMIHHAKTVTVNNTAFPEDEVNTLIEVMQEQQRDYFMLNNDMKVQLRDAVKQAWASEKAEVKIGHVDFIFIRVGEEIDIDTLVEKYNLARADQNEDKRPTMMEQRLLPFDYLTFVVTTNVVRAIREVAAASNTPPLESHMYALITQQLGLLNVEPNPQAIEHVLAYHRDKQYVFRTLGKLDSQIDALLKSVDYFPENYSDYAEVLGSDRDDMLAHHGDLLAFWRQYATHVNGRNALFAYASLFGASQNVQVQEANDYDCLYHRGMNPDSVHPVVKTIVEIYDNVETLLGFTPAHTPPNISLKLGDDDFVVTANERGEVETISLTTLVGRIWLKGSPKAEDLGGTKIKLV